MRITLLEIDLRFWDCSITLSAADLMGSVPNPAVATKISMSAFCFLSREFWHYFS